MMKKMKQTLALLISAMVLLSAFAGCTPASNNSSAAGDTGSKDSSVADTGTETGEKVNGLMYPEGLPIVDEDTFTFSIFVDDSTATGEFWMLEELEKQTNVKVDLRYSPYETARERLNLDLNSGDYADVIGGWTLTDSVILTQGVENGVFIPLEDLYAQYAPKITEILNLEGVREQMTAPDGHIYAIPYVTGDTTVNFSPFINTRWLENVGMDMPTTTEEFEAVLMAFKEKDANGNGDPNDEIPFSTDPNNPNLEGMTGWIGGMPMNKWGFSYYEGETVYGGISNMYRELLSWLNGMYEKGLIDQEIFTQDTSTWEGKGGSDLYGVSIAYGSNEFSGIAQAEERSEFDYLPVLNADKGGKWLRATTGFSVYRTQAVITDNCTNPEIVIRWFDNAFSLENGIGCAIGPVGTVVFEEGDNYRKIDTKTLGEEMEERVSWANLWPQALPKYLPKGFKPQEDVVLYDEKKAVELAYEDYLTDEIVDRFWVDLEDVDRYSELSNAIENFYKEQKAQFISGEIDIDDDAAWNSYVSGMKAIGLEDWVRMRGVETIIDNN